MQIKERSIKELVESEYNPRTLGKEDEKALRDSMQRFGCVDPIIVNTHEDRRNIVIGGHQRLRIWQELGHDTIPCVEVELDRDRERELNIRLNRNTGEFDDKALAEFFEKQELEGWGFPQDELNAIFAESQQAAEPEEQAEVEFSEELLLEHNYVVLYFSNPMDWQVAMDKLGLKQVKDLIPRKNQPTGTGRVIDGSKVLERLQGDS